MEKGKYFYRGKDVTEMTHEELIDAVINLGELHKETLDRHIRDLDTLFSFRGGTA